MSAAAWPQSASSMWSPWTCSQSHANRSWAFCMRSVPSLPAYASHPCCCIVSMADIAIVVFQIQKRALAPGPCRCQCPQASSGGGEAPPPVSSGASGRGQAYYVDDMQALALGPGDLGELAMLDEYGDYVSIGQGFIGRGQAATLERRRQLFDVGFDIEHVARHLLADVLCDVQGRALAQVIDVRLESQAKQRDLDFFRRGSTGLDLADCGLDLRRDPVRLAVVDLAGDTGQAGLFGGLVDDEPRIHGDAVSADAGARLQDVDARM